MRNSCSIGNSLIRYCIPITINFFILDNLLESIKKESERIKNSSHNVAPNLKFLIEILTQMKQCITNPSDENLKKYKKLIKISSYRKYNHYKTRVGWRMYSFGSFLALNFLCLAVVGGLIAATPLAPTLIILGISFAFGFGVLAIAGILLKNLGQAQTIIKHMNQFYKFIQNTLQRQAGNSSSLPSQPTEKNAQITSSIQPLLKTISDSSLSALLPENVINLSSMKRCKVSD